MIQAVLKDWQDRRSWLQFVLVTVLAVFSLSIFLGWNAKVSSMVMVGAAVGGLVMFVFLSRWIEVGVLGLILLSYVGRYVIKTGTNVDLNLTIMGGAFLIIVWVIKMVVVDHHLRLESSRVNTPALLFILATTLSLIAGNLHWVQQAEVGASVLAQLGGWTLYVLSIGLMLLVGNTIRDQHWLRLIVWFFLGMGAIYILGRLFPFIGVYTNKYIQIGTSSVFFSWLVALAYGQVITNNQLAKRYRFLLGLLVAGALYVVWFKSRSWVSGWMPGMVAVVVITWLRSWRWGLALTILAGGYVLLSYPSLTAMIMDPSQQYSLTSRMGTWPVMWELMKASPIIGLGPSNYYHYTVLYPILGWYVKFNSHNNYVDIVAQTGLLGLFLFAWLVVELGLLGMRLRLRLQDGFSKGYIYAILGGLVGMLASGVLGDWFLPFLYNIGFSGFRGSSFAWLFIGGMLALDRFSRSVPSTDQLGE
jgi:O-antigen ligase